MKLITLDGKETIQEITLVIPDDDEDESPEDAPEVVDADASTTDEADAPQE